MRHSRRFAYQLALALGCPNVDAMLRSMTSEQFAEWFAYYEIAPFGKPAEDVRLASLSAVVANFSPKFRKSDFKPADFLPQPEEKPASLSAKILTAFRKMGARNGND